MAGVMDPPTLELDHATSMMSPAAASLGPSLSPFAPAMEDAKGGPFGHTPSFLLHQQQHHRQPHAAFFGAHPRAGAEAACFPRPPPAAGTPLLRFAFYFKEALRLALSPNGETPDGLLGAGCIHVLDFDIGMGEQWASLMQELAQRRPATARKVTSLVSPASHHPLELQLIHENLSSFAAAGAECGARGGGRGRAGWSWTSHRSSRTRPAGGCEVVRRQRTFLGLVVAVGTSN
ncbi:hypothetical protein VPH35_112495 [Triticum aestivum]